MTAYTCPYCRGGTLETPSMSCAGEIVTSYQICVECEMTFKIVEMVDRNGHKVLTFDYNLRHARGK